MVSIVTAAGGMPGPSVTALYAPQRFPMPSVEQMLPLFRKTRAAYPDVRVHWKPTGPSQLMIDQQEPVDFADAWYRLEFMKRLPEVDRTRNLITWSAELTGWFLENGLGQRTVWGAPFVMAALAHGDIPVELRDPISLTHFGVARFGCREPVNLWRAA